MRMRAWVISTILHHMRSFKRERFAAEESGFAHIPQYHQRDSQ